MTSFDETTKIWKSRVVPSSFPNDVHISEIILNCLKRTPNRILQIFDENGAQLTCDELRLQAIRIAQNLTKLGIGKGDVVAFNCTNSEHIYALLNGCIFIGALISSMSVMHDENDLRHFWSITEPKFVFCDTEVYVKTVNVLRSMENNATVCTLIERIDDVLFVDDVMATTGIEESFEAIKLKGNSLLCLSSSSGTTGPAKAVCVSQSTFLQFAEVYQNDDFRFLHFSPIFWSLAIIFFVVLPLTKLVRVVTRRLGSVENYLELIAKYKVECLYTNPALLNQLLKTPLIEKANLSSLKVVASVGAICHPDLRIKFKEIFPGKQLIVPYGSTEVFFAFPSLNDDNQGYAVGRLLPNSEVKIVDDEGNHLGVNQTGEVCVRLNFPFPGYYKNPEATTATVDRDQFMKTGDVGYMDSHGILNIVDRKKDIFKYHLHHINPAEIENVLQSLDGVEQVSVVGIPYEKTNFACAVVKKSEGYDHLTEDDVIAYVADRLPEYKQLHGGVCFVNKFPTTPTGKIIKRLIEAIAEEQFKKQKSNN